MTQVVVPTFMAWIATELLEGTVARPLGFAPVHSSVVVVAVPEVLQDTVVEAPALTVAGETAIDVIAAGSPHEVPDWVWPAGHTAVTGAAARLAGPPVANGLVTLSVQVVVPAFGAGSEPLPPIAGVRL